MWYIAACQSADRTDQFSQYTLEIIQEARICGTEDVLPVDGQPEPEEGLPQRTPSIQEST